MCDFTLWQYGVYNYDSCSYPGTDIFSLVDKENYEQEIIKVS